MKTKKKEEKVYCEYCTKEAVKVNSRIVYGKDYGDIYLCTCLDGWAYVGCNKKTGKPLGTLANKSLREKRKEAHKYFDKLWKNKFMTRTKAYSLLAKELNLTKDECHIAMFNKYQCEDTIWFSRRLYKDVKFNKEKTI